MASPPSQDPKTSGPNLWTLPLDAIFGQPSLGGIKFDPGFPCPDFPHVVFGPGFSRPNFLPGGFFNGEQEGSLTSQDSKTAGPDVVRPFFLHARLFPGRNAWTPPLSATLGRPSLGDLDFDPESPRPTSQTGHRPVWTRYHLHLKFFCFALPGQNL
jgi:hypothetical protein